MSLQIETHKYSSSEGRNCIPRNIVGYSCIVPFGNKEVVPSRTPMVILTDNSNGSYGEIKNMPQM